MSQWTRDVYLEKEKEKNIKGNMNKIKANDLRKICTFLTQT